MSVGSIIYDAGDVLRDLVTCFSPEAIINELKDSHIKIIKKMKEVKEWEGFIEVTKNIERIEGWNREEQLYFQLKKYPEGYILAYSPKKIEYSLFTIEKDQITIENSGKNKDNYKILDLFFDRIQKNLKIKKDYFYCEDGGDE